MRISDIMGCSVSKPDRDEELPAGFGSVKWICNEAAGHSRGRSGSLELLRPMELEDDIPVSQPQSPMKERPPRGYNATEMKGEQETEMKEQPPREYNATVMKEEQEKEMKEQPPRQYNATEMKSEQETELGKGKRAEEVVKMVVLERKTNEVIEEANGGVSTEEYELGMPPASPSFRFYFSESMQDFEVDDFRVEQHGNKGMERNGDLISEDIKEETPHPHTRESSNESVTSGEEFDGKKVKTKRFRVLSRAPSAVFKSIFNVRNCYSSHSSVAVAANVPQMPKLIAGKAA